MSKIRKAFQKYLNSDIPCDSVKKAMNGLSKYSLNQKINEEIFIREFFKYCQKNFLNEIIEYQKSKKIKEITLSVEEVFNFSHYILINHKANFENKKAYERIEFIYKTFFFIELDKNNETNDFTFFSNIPRHLIKEEEYELYLLNIGMIILSPEESLPLIEVLFSVETPEFLKNIILTCFEYIRLTKKNIVDFIELCIPCLNHFNLYYLSHVIRRDLHYNFSQIDQINYIKLENFINGSIENNIILDEPNQNFISIEKGKNEVINNNSQLNEEKSKYFCFPNEDDKKNNLIFFTENNLKENKEKFLKFLNFKTIEDKEKYTIFYDQIEKNDKSINSFSFPFLLKNNLIEKLDEHFFQIYNYGNVKNELFSHILSQYLNSINKYLKRTLTNEEKIELFKNSGFYKLNNEYILLVNVDESEEKLFYLKINLGQKEITSKNEDKNFEVFHVNQPNCSTTENNSVSEYFNLEDKKEEALYNFGNYSFEQDLRKYFKNVITNYSQIYELPRLYFLLNYSIPISKNEYQFITNIKIKNNNDKSQHSYGFSELDFVLKNDSNDDIIIDMDYRPYKQQIFMLFPKTNINNNEKIILKKKSIIFFEFKELFPQYSWKDKFTFLFKKIKNFIDVYQKRGEYNNEYIQIYFVYDNMPEIYYIREMKRFLNNNFANMFSKFEFGIFYFTRAISLINDQKVNQNIEDLKADMNEFMTQIINILDILPYEEVKEKVNQLKTAFIKKNK